MANKNELSIHIIAKDSATAELKRLQGSISSLGGSVKSAAQAFQSYWAAAAAAVYAAIRTISGAWGLFEQGAARKEQIEALDRLVAKYKTSAGDIVDAIKLSSHGLVDTKTALDSVGEAVMRNLDPRILKDFAQGAVVMAKATGQSTSEAYAQIIDAVSRGAPRALKRIAGVVDMKEIFGEKWTSFSETQQAALRLELVLKKLQERYTALGGITDSTDDKIVRFKNTLAGMKASVGMAMESMFGGVFGAFAEQIDAAAKNVKSFMQDNEGLLGSIGGVFKAIGDSIVSVGRAIGVISKEMGVWQILWTAFTAGLKVANLAIALFADFVGFIKMGLYAIGWLLDKVVIAPLRTIAYWGAELAEKLGFDKAAAGLRGFIQLSQAGADQIEEDLKKMAVDNWNQSNWDKAVAANKKLLAVQQEGVKAAKEAKKEGGGFTPPPVTGYSADQKKAVKDFLSWYVAQSSQVSAEIKALYGDEAGALKDQKIKALEEISTKMRELARSGILEEKKGGGFEISAMLSEEGRKAAEDALAKINALKEQYAILFNARALILQKQQDAKIAELSIYDFDAIHKAKLELLKVQYKENAEMLKAATDNENLLYGATLRERANEARKMQEDTAALWLEGSQKTIADLQSAYQDDLAAFRERVYQKKATWADYDSYVRAREHRLQEDLKKIQGTSTDGMKDAVRDYIDESSNQYNRGRDFFNKSVGGMESAIGDFLFAAGQGTFKVKEMFQSMGLSVLKAASEIIAKMIALRIVSGLGSMFGFTSTSSAAGAQGGFGPASGGSPVTAYAAMGGIFQGGFQPAYAISGGGSMPFRAFSSGGIVKRPTVGLVGEGGQNEAVVPLPDGKAIPVKMQGGDGGERTVVVRNEWTINTLDATGFDQLLASRKSTIDGMMADSLARAGLVRDAVRRYR